MHFCDTFAHFILAGAHDRMPCLIGNHFGDGEEDSDSRTNRFVPAILKPPKRT